MPDRPSTLERVVLFSDAVFAIAITLLIIDVRLPDSAGASNGPGPAAVLSLLAPRIVSFVLSFVVIALYWIGHNRIFASLDDDDGALIALNFTFLLFVVFIPFPTSFLGAYGDQAAGPLVYAAANVAAGASQTALWLYAGRRGLLERTLPARYVAYRAWYLARIPAVFLASIPLGLAIGAGAVYSWAAIIPAGWLVRRWYRDVADFDPDHPSAPSS